MMMKQHSLTLLFSLLIACSNAQPLQQRLANAAEALVNDPQMRHAILGLQVVETATGKKIYGYNDQAGLAPASTQKIFTSIAALETLGIHYRYATTIATDSTIADGQLYGNLVITGSGDPSLGSWRYANTTREKVLTAITGMLQQQGIRQVQGNIILNDSAFSYQPLPGGWIWDDIGNYYGAGTWAINWNENQYDLLLKPGKKEGDPVTITGTTPVLRQYTITNLLTTGKPGSGDNGYIYFPPYARNGFVEGTVPPQQQFTLSGALPYPALQMGNELQQQLAAAHIQFNGNITTTQQMNDGNVYAAQQKKVLGTLYSPTLDSLVYWFMQKSINLYGEALIKTMAYKKTGSGSTKKGVEVLQDFWKQQGIEPAALNIMDGSGLSPQNRVTAAALVQALQYARNRNWFSAFKKALPVYNGMTMKSGTIGGAKAYAGYHTAKDGTGYTFAIIINNYDDAKNGIVQKMFAVLDELK